MNSPLLEKSLDLATEIVIFYENFSKSHKDTTIAKQLLEELKERMAKLEISMEFTPEAVKCLAGAPGTQKYGARPMRNYLTEQVENPLAQRILCQHISAGDSIRLSADEKGFLLPDKAYI